MNTKQVTFDPTNPDKDFVRMVLHQAFGCDPGSLKEIFDAAWCLREMDRGEWAKLRGHLLDNQLIEDSGEREYFRMTRKGEDVLGGEDY